MIKLFFVGDVFNNSTEQKQLLSDELKNELNNYHIKSCNFEAPVVKSNMKPIKKAGPVKGQSMQTAKILIEEGFNLINIANNHIMDYGEQGLAETLKAFENYPIIGAGFGREDTYKPYIYEFDNIKVGFISIAENGFGCFEDNEKYGYAWMYEQNMYDRIVKLKRECDYIILNIHAGAENFKYPLPEIRTLYKKFIDMGVDLIIGHHPHIIQGYEEYKGKKIFYSLGNFAFEGFINESGRKSYAVSVSIDINSGISCDIIPLIYKDGIVNKNKNIDDKLEIEEISKELNTTKYLDMVNNFAENIYQNTYKNYYLNSLGIKNYTFLNKIKQIVRILKMKDNDILMYHNLNIETHLWLCKRALKNRILEEDND